MKTRPANFRYERGSLGGQVMHLEADRVFIRDTDAGLLLDWIVGNALLSGVTAADLQADDLIFV